MFHNKMKLKFVSTQDKIKFVSTQDELKLCFTTR